MRTQISGRPPFRAIRPTLPILALLFGLAGGAAAGQERKDPGLDVQIHLDTPLGTVQAFVAALSTQSALKIECADDIAPREVGALLEGLRVRDALDAITRLNDWKWQEIGPAHYEICRQRARQPAKASDVPRALQAALPPELRVFLKLPDLKSKDPYAIVGMGTAGGRLVMPYALAAELRGAVAPYLEAHPRRKYDDLTSPQQRDVLLFLFLRRFRDCVELLYGDYGVNRMELPRLFLALENGGGLLAVKMDPDDNGKGGGGFGVGAINP